MTPRRATRDEVLAALDDLAKKIEDNAQDQRVLARRIRRLRDARAKGAPWVDVLDAETDPGALHLVGVLLSRLSEGSGRFRRELAVALRREGESIPAIARRFGVTHQRVSSLLQRRG
jgi:hypothetical protein